MQKSILAVKTFQTIEQTKRNLIGVTLFYNFMIYVGIGHCYYRRHQKIWLGNCM